MTNQPQELWFAVYHHDGWDIQDNEEGGGKLIVRGPLDEEVARRIVECVNFCAGVELPEGVTLAGLMEALQVIAQGLEEATPNEYEGRALDFRNIAQRALRGIPLRFPND